MGTERTGMDAAMLGTDATLLLIFVFWNWRRDFNSWPPDQIRCSTAELWGLCCRDGGASQFTVLRAQS